MADDPKPSGVTKELLDRLATGDEAAADELIAHAMERVRRMARTRLHRNPIVERNEQTDDLVQGAAMRLHRALKSVKPPTVRDFINLAAEQIRRELIDLYRHHRGPQADAAHRASDHGWIDSEGRVHPMVEAQADSQPGPATQLLSKELDEQIQGLPGEEGEVFRLIFYMGMSQDEVAKRLEVSVPTVKRRWRSARLKLHDLLKSEEFEDNQQK